MTPAAAFRGRDEAASPVARRPRGREAGHGGRRPPASGAGAWDSPAGAGLADPGGGGGPGTMRAAPARGSSGSGVPDVCNT